MAVGFVKRCPLPRLPLRSPGVRRAGTGRQATCAASARHRSQSGAGTSDTVHNQLPGRCHRNVAGEPPVRNRQRCGFAGCRHGAVEEDGCWSMGPAFAAARSRHFRRPSPSARGRLDALNPAYATLARDYGKQRF